MATNYEPLPVFIKEHRHKEGITPFIITAALRYEGYDLATEDPEEVAEINGRIEATYRFNRLGEYAEENIPEWLQEECDG